MWRWRCNFEADACASAGGRGELDEVCDQISQHVLEQGHAVTFCESQDMAPSLPDRMVTIVTRVVALLLPVVLPLATPDDIDALTQQVTLAAQAEVFQEA